MKFSSILCATGALFISATANAQTDASARLMPLPNPVIKYGGIYNVATGTWTSSLSAKAASAETIYDNTCTVGSFLSLNPGESTVDAGRVPSTTSPNSTFSAAGTSDVYDLHFFDLAYCTSEPSVDLAISFFECYDPCGDASTLVPTYSFDILGAPGSAGGSLDCWNVTIDLGDLASAPTFQGDCDGQYDNVRAQDLFGWSFEQVTAPVNGAFGPLIAGDPFGLLGGGAAGSGCGWGEGTTFSTGTQGTGMGTDDLFELDANGAMVGCFFFGGYFVGSAYSSVYLELGGAPPAPPSAGAKFCFGDGQNTACPCGNDNDGSVAGGLSGCANGSSTGGAALDVTGTASIAADDLVLSTEGLVPNQPGLYFQGVNAINSGAGVTFGDGLRCAGGGVIRLDVAVANSSGISTTAGTSISTRGLVAAGDTLRYQLWYRDPAGSPCGTSFNLSNGYEITWQL